MSATPQNTGLAPTLAEQLSVTEIGPDMYESFCLPLRMGNAAPIAFGGSTLGVALHAAALTVPPSHKLYSCLGHYLGPAQTDTKIQCKVERTRDTRSFTTRRVQVLQRVAGKERTCLDFLVDFHIEESPLFIYSSPPVQSLPPPEDCIAWDDALADFAGRGLIDAQAIPAYRRAFLPMHSYFEQRGVPEGVSAQNLIGLAKNAVTSQDKLPITSKWSADWDRLKESPRHERDQIAALAFLLDTAISFLPMTHSNMFWDDAGPCSSLDFALRVFVPRFDLHEWHVRQSMTKTAAAGRTYSENLLWDREGRMVASMTQQSILRPKPGQKLINLL